MLAAIGECTLTNPFVSVPNAFGGVDRVAFINGNPLPRAPKWVGNLTLRYSHPVGNDGDFYVLTDWSFRDTLQLLPVRSTGIPGQAFDRRRLARRLQWNDGRYELAGYARNITNRQQLIGAIDFNNLTGIVNEPRNIGVQFRANF